jgi:hypothetical protein
MRNLALLALGLRKVSLSAAIIGFFVISLSVGAMPQTQTGMSFEQTHPFAADLNAFFTNLSSSE